MAEIFSTVSLLSLHVISFKLINACDCSLFFLLLLSLHINEALTFLFYGIEKSFWFLQLGPLSQIYSVSLDGAENNAILLLILRQKGSA